ncbi:transporter [Clostridium sp.]|uniref:transporter n=1 Tax=Clostridium sp. TaxID=1506 RepID=UPI003F33002A
MGALNFQVIAILAVFAVFIGLIIAKKLPTLIALPVLGIIVAFIAGVPFMSADPEEQTIMMHVINGGASRMAGTMIAAVFGAMFAKVIYKQGISNTIIRKAAELAGDKPLLISIILTAATAIIFSAIGGAGAVIMVSTIVIPLMISAGINPTVAASSVLMGISLGGLLNVSNYQFYVDTIGMSMDTVKSSSMVLVVASIVLTLVYILINVRKTAVRSTWAMPTSEFGSKINDNVSFLALISPLVPIVLVFVFKLDVIVTLIIATIYAIVTTKPKQIVQVATSSLVEGIQDVAGVIGLFIGIGILLNGTSANATVALMQPVISAIVPTSPMMYVVVFTILSPLALYRGPLNMYGLGSGIGNIMLAAGTLSPAAVGIALRSTGIVQGIADPTNSQNVIVADYAKCDVNDILKSTLPYTILITALGLSYTALMLF